MYIRDLTLKENLEGKTLEPSTEKIISSHHLQEQEDLWVCMGSEMMDHLWTPLLSNMQTRSSNFIR